MSVNHVEVEDLDAYLNNFSDEVSSFTNVDLQKYEPSSSSAVSSLPLRVIYPLFGPGVEVECILDSGAQIVIMRRDIWEKLRVPITSSKAMNLEAANSSTTLTMGLVENLPVKMGPITVYLQVQVVQDAPFEVLLGRPFFDVTSCTDISQSGGGHQVTLKDPKTGESYVFPTQPRIRHLPRSAVDNEKPTASVNFRL